MRKEEAQILRHDIQKLIEKKGMPINIRNGGNLIIADWVCQIFDKSVQIDEPLGVIQGNDYDHCPRCNGIVGQSAYYCKLCGAKIREGGR